MMALIMFLAEGAAEVATFAEITEVEDEVEDEVEEEEEGKEEKKALSGSMKSRLNAELTHKKRVIYKKQRQEAKKRRVKDT